MAINETLKFSWGHIIAFVAMIFISYVSFMGITYLTDGDFIVAGIGVSVINLLLIVFFIVPQILKGADEKFGKKIVRERLLIFIAPIFFVVAMIPFAHFWTVYDSRETVESTFKKAITTTKGMFDSYEEYANNRIIAYDTVLVAAEAPLVSRNNKVEALRLQIVADNYEALKKIANQWIDDTSEATVWNVFMIGNIKKVEAAVDGWHQTLTTFSSKKMSDEAEEVAPFSLSNPSVTAAKASLAELRSIYKTMATPTPLAIGVGLFLCLLLLLPYIIQRRNVKSLYRLIGSKRKSSQKCKNNDGSAGGDDTFVMASNETSDNSSDFGSFKM